MAGGGGGKRLRLSTLRVLGVARVIAMAGAFISTSAADEPPPPLPPPTAQHGCCPVPLTIAPAPLWPLDWGQRFELRAWRSDRVDGVMRETIRFIFCSSLSAGPFRVRVTESRGWDRNAKPAGVPRYAWSGRFRLRLDKRYAFGVPQCRQVTYSWHPKRVMLLPGTRALDVTIAYPRVASSSSALRLVGHETAIR
jgi:hypothetical protein